MYNFTADDVFRMAEQMECNGAAFYRNAAAGTVDLENRKMLLGLAAMEDEHERTFADIRSLLTSQEQATTVFDPAGEAAFYLKALVDTKVFFQKTIDTSSLLEILKEALIAEKDSIVFYLGMKEVVPQRLGKARLDDIIKEEMGHITLIGKHLKSLRS